MPSKSPPLYLPQPRPPRPLVRPPSGRPKPPLINWPVVGAAAAVSFALIVCTIAWIVTHPGQTPRPIVVALAPAAQPNAEPLILAHASQPGDDRIVPAAHRAERQDVLLNHIPPAVELPAPPPLPQPARVRVAEPTPPPPNARPQGETYGTSVLFLSNPEEAAETARREKRLLFVLHVSGNFEDSCFT